MIRTGCLAGLTVLAPVVSLAAEAPVKKADSIDTTGSVISLAIGVLVVIAAIFVLAWLSRRLLGVNYGGASSLRIDGGLALGSREKLVVVEVEGRRLLLGMTPGSISLVTELEPSTHHTEQSGDGSVANRTRFNELLETLKWKK